MLHSALKKYFGFEQFHKGQEAVIQDVMAGRPTVAIMPTGAGKSLCYQLPALLLDGITVVVSPLIALMKDQVDSLRARGIPAESINSSQSPEARQETLQNLMSGQCRIIYIAPERFRQNSFIHTLQRQKIALFAVDEAHCISRWGHDFRPDYVRLGEVLERLKPPQILACTATATPDVREDIHRVLGLNAPSVHVAGFLRSNLFLETQHCSGDRDRWRRVLSFLSSEIARQGALILYASTRKRVEHFADLCAGELGDRMVVRYHGGMQESARTESQERFMSGQARVAVATNAFGMGVDRADVRAVLHLDLPRTVEGYYQEVGRAGRDGEPAHCLLLYNPNDSRIHEFLIDLSHPSREAFKAVWSMLHKVPSDLRVKTDLLDAQVRMLDLRCSTDAILRQLQRLDLIRYEGERLISVPAGAPEALQELGIPFEEIERHRGYELQKLRLMRRFIHHSSCRHAFILDYFGEEMEGSCPGCDRCGGSREGGLGVESGEPSPEEALIIRKALAGVARAEGRFGLKKVAAMLFGSRAKTLTRTSLIHLSTHGILKELGRERCEELLLLLIDRGLCRVIGDDYPLIQITAEGWELMQGRSLGSFKLPPNFNPKSKESSPRGEIDHSELDENLEAWLRHFRLEQARIRGVPAFQIFPNSVLQILASRPPSTERQFLLVKGLGRTRWSQFGQALLDGLQKRSAHP